VLGTPGGVDVLATYLYDMISTGFAPDYGQAAAVGMSVLSASIALIVLYRALTAESEKYVTLSARGFRPGVTTLGAMRRPLGLLVGLLCLLMVVLPVLVLLYTSLVPYVMPPGPQAFAAMDLRHWIAVFHEPGARLALRNSLFLAAVGATLGVALSLGIAYVVVRTRGPLATVLDTLGFLPLSFPGIVIGIGFMWFFVQTPLHSTLTALLLAYVAVYLPHGVRPLASAFTQIHSHLEESSLVCGASRLTTLRRVVIPLLTPGMVFAWILMATLFLHELTVSVVLSRPGTEVLSIQILGYADDGLWGKLSALGLFMIALSTLLVCCAQAAGRALRRHQGLQPSGLRGFMPRQVR
jgi:iron(III) transport system permease protein